MSGTTYTFTQKPQPAEPGEESNFGGAVVDGNHNFLVGVGNGFQTVDISASPLTSPLTTSTSVTTTLNVPLNAMSVTLIAITNPIIISESSSTLATGFQIPVASPITIEIGRQSIIYLRAVTGAGTCAFYFNII